MKYLVTVTRTEHRDHTFVVEARNKEEAEELGLEMSNDHEFDEDEICYANEEVTSVMHK